MTVREYPVGPTTCGVGAHESVAVMFRVLVPVPVGVPLNNPVSDRESPAGMLFPVQVTVPIPPTFTNWNENGWPCVAVCSGLVELTENDGHETVIEITLVAVFSAESLTWNVTESDSAEVGVPVIAPAGERFSPGGRCPAIILKLYGGTPPVAARLAL